jgi:REP element-mobilizing transposase RayT
LPHWESDNATYFITFRLADSLPKTILDRIASERESIVQLARQQARELTASECQHLKRLTTVRIEQYLDSGAGKCSLRVRQVGAIVAETLLLFDEKRYRLSAWCIMPNHVHVVAKVFPTAHLADVLHSWKSYTAREANRILATHGTFWQREYYDHLLRDEAQFQRAVKYVLENPVKANLRDWEWVWVRGQGARATAGEGAGATLETASPAAKHNAD